MRDLPEHSITDRLSTDPEPQHITDRSYRNPWTYRGTQFSLPDEELEKFTGFVYLIQCLAPEKEGRYYVGQKLLWRSVKRSRTDRKTKKRKVFRERVPSDWKDYYGSSEELRRDVEEVGADSFSREVLHLCESKGAMNYVELKEQIERKVLFDELSYNAFAGTKVHRNHVRKVTPEQR